MGGIGKTLFGSPGKQESESSSTSESGNHAWGVVNPALSPALGYVTSGGNMVQNLLMGSGQNESLNNFANSTGMNFVMDQGSRAITGNMAAKGLLNSGSTLKALNKFGQGVGSTYLNNYMDNLFKLSNIGLGAGNVLSSAGNWSKGQSESTSEGKGGKEGIAGTLLSAAAMIPGISDRRLKSNIVHVDTLFDGLKVYEYDLFGKRQRGVMADEVKKLRPEAHKPGLFLGYDGVDYSKIEELN
jgi:hypothetical protein